jgi:hypothetical protein
MLGVIYNSPKMLKMIIWQLAINLALECRCPSLRLREAAIVAVLLLFLHFGLMPENNIYIFAKVCMMAIINKTKLFP